jgi:predicted nucleic acid-binding Zn ribbon protein
MKKKTHEEFCNEVYLKTGKEYTVKSTYINSKIKVLMKHNTCGHEWEVVPTQFISESTRCPECAKIKRSQSQSFNIKEVKHFIEIESNSGCKLISNKYNNCNTKLIIQCKCGNCFETSFLYFKHENKRQCDTCGLIIRGNGKRLKYEDVKKYIEIDSGSNCILLSKSYKNNSTPLKMQCERGHIFYQTLNDFQDGHWCKWCSFEDLGRISIKYSIEEIRNILMKENYILLSDVYTSIKEKLRMKCPKGHIFEMSFRDFNVCSHRCPQCYKEHFLGISSMNQYLRAFLIDWRKKSMKECNYKCIITGDKFDVIHHLYSFNNILKEAFIQLKMPIKKKINEYSQEELQQIINVCVDLHEKYPLGVCLRKDVHILFHSIYGKHNNTPEQFEEFKTNYKINNCFNIAV